MNTNNQKTYSKTELDSLREENENLRNDLDELIKCFYTWGISNKKEENFGSDYTPEMEGYDTMNNLLNEGKKLSKKYGMYPYNQEIVRMTQTNDVFF